MSDRELLETLHMTIVALAQEVKEACKTVSAHNATLYGNHKKGLVEDNVETKTKISILFWVASVVGAAAITAAVTSIWQLVAK